MEVFLDLAGIDAEKMEKMWDVHGKHIVVEKLDGSETVTVQVEEAFVVKL